MRPTSAIAILLFFLSDSAIAAALLPQAAPPGQEHRMITISALRVRERPSGRAPIKGNVRRLETYAVLERSDNTDRAWLKIAYDRHGHQGWIQGRYTIPVTLPVRRRYRPTSEELDLLYRTVCAESKAEPYEGKVAVAAVVLNRIGKPGFRRTMRGVLVQRGQFQPVFQGTIWRVRVSQEVRNACEEALNGRDDSLGSLYFLNRHLTNPDPRWTQTKQFTVRIGDHWFYK